MNFQQLELQLEETLEEATENPSLANIKQIWQQLEPALTQLGLHEQLSLGGKAIEQLAKIYHSKAQWLLEEWEHTYNPQDPEVPSDWLQGFVKQSQQLDLSNLTAPNTRPRKQKPSRPKDNDSLVGQVPKENILDMLDQVEAEEQKAKALAVAHEENIQTWVAELSDWFQQNPQTISLLQLRHQLDWPLIQLWLSLLLGGFKIEAMGSEFYSHQILVSYHPNSE